VLLNDDRIGGGSTPPRCGAQRGGLLRRLSRVSSPTSGGGVLGRNGHERRQLSRIAVAFARRLGGAGLDWRRSYNEPGDGPRLARPSGPKRALRSPPFFGAVTTGWSGQRRAALSDIGAGRSRGRGTFFDSARRHGCRGGGRVVRLSKAQSWPRSAAALVVGTLDVCLLGPVRRDEP